MPCHARPVQVNAVQELSNRFGLVQEEDALRKPYCVQAQDIAGPVQMEGVIINRCLSTLRSTLWTQIDTMDSFGRSIFPFLHLPDLLLL